MTWRDNVRAWRFETHVLEEDAIPHVKDNAARGSLLSIYILDDNYQAKASAMTPLSEETFHTPVSYEGRDIGRPKRLDRDNLRQTFSISDGLERP